VAVGCSAIFCERCLEDIKHEDLEWDVRSSIYWLLADKCSGNAQENVGESFAQPAVAGGEAFPLKTI